MNTERTDWKEEVISSMKGSKKANPNSDLLAKIQTQIIMPNANIIPLNRLKTYAVAGILIALMNIAAVILFNQNEELPIEKTAIEVSNNSLITSFQIY